MPPRGAPSQVEFSYIAANVRRARARREMTQAELAEEAGVDVTYVAKIEAARVNLSVAVLLALAEALDVPATSLFRKATLERTGRGRPARTR